MVAAVQIESSDEVQSILRRHPEVQGFIRRVTEVSESYFPGGAVHLEPGRYEDDPPLMLTIRVDDPAYDFTAAMYAFGTWLGREPGYDLAVISAVPMPYWSRVPAQE